MSKNFIIFGASHGLGDAFVKGLPTKGDTVWVVSRTRPSSLDINDGVNRKWLAIDLSSQQQIPFLKETLKDIAIDVLIYNVGVWEKCGFEDDYTFDKDEVGDISNIINDSNPKRFKWIFGTIYSGGNEKYYTVCCGFLRCFRQV